MQELRKEKYEFERDVLNVKYHNRNGNEAGEKVTRFFDDKMKSKVGEIRISTSWLSQKSYAMLSSFLYA